MTSIERPLRLVVYFCTFNKCTKKSCSYHRSVVYKRAGMHFVELKNLQKHRAMDEKSFFIIDDVFLATASHPAESFPQSRNRSQFVLSRTLFLLMRPGPCIPLSCAVKLRNGKRAACNHGVMDARGRLLLECLAN